MGTSSKAAERKVILELTELLQNNASKVLSGETNLCLTTSSLSILSTNFRKYSESSAQDASSGSGRSKNKQDIDPQKWMNNIRILYDFVIKVKALKIIHSSCTMKSPVQIARFRSIQVLEVKKLPIHMVEGLSILRGQLREITVTRSIETIKDLLEICGGDRSPGLVWSNLKNIYLSFNDLKHLDASLRFIPFVEVVDLSHNIITQADDFLKCLNDVARINLSYNMFRTVPVFSTSCHLQLKTLVLRRNQLDNLEGVQALTALEELDISDNFLLDHKLLSPLAGLNRLQVLCLSGNPLCYKSNHRLLTVAHVSPVAGLGIFLLDGKRLLQEELAVLRQSQYRAMSQDTTVTVSINDGTEEDVDDSGEIAVSQLTPRKKRGHQRKRSMERVPKIEDIETSMMAESLPRSKGATPSTSYAADDPHSSTELEEERKKYEVMRAYYKDDWLKALTAEQGDQQGPSGPLVDREESVERIPEPGSDQLDGTKPQLPGQGAEGTQGPPSQQTDATIHPIVAEKDQPVRSQLSPHQSPLSPQEIHIGPNTDIYVYESRKMEKAQVAQPDILRLYSQTSVDKHSPDDAEEIAKYGEESDPFIVMLPSDDMKPALVTMNTRFLIEKNLNGQKQGSLDLKCLLNVGVRQEKCEGTDIIGGLLFYVLTADFDYVKKDSRQRKYAFEDQNEAETLKLKLLPYIKQEKEVEHWMECLKCHSEFKPAQSYDPSALIKCPRCNSKMVVQMDKRLVPIITTEDSAESDSSAGRVEGKEDRLMHGSRFERKKRVHRQKERRENFPGQKLSSSLKDYVDRNIIVEEDPVNALPHKNGSDSVLKKAADSVTSGLRSNSSWSDVRGSASRTTRTRDSVSSIESDITVLASNSNQAAVPSISGSSYEVITSSAAPSFSVIAEDGKVVGSGNPIPSNGRSESSEGIYWTKDKQGQITPVGSPLSNSICSSMVSSVYENTLANEGEKGSVSDSPLDTGHLTGSSSDSVTVRRSGGSDRSRSRSSEHREAKVYGNTASLHSESNIRNSSAEDTFALRRGREGRKNRSGLNGTFDSSSTQDSSSSHSIYDTASSKTNESVPSIYDSHVIQGYGLDSSRDDSASFRDSKESSVSHDLVTNQNESSPVLRRNKRSNENLARGNRSAIYSNINLEESSEQEVGTDMPDFPSHLSPIKRTRGTRSPNRSAVITDEMYQASDASVSSIEVSEPQTSGEEAGLKSANQSSVSAASALLPWEQTGNESKASGRDESLNHEEFVNIDHRVQLYLELKVFKAEETAQCAIQCNIVQYSKRDEIRSLLVISTNRIMIFEITADSTEADDWLVCYEDQPITELQYIDIGLDYQTLRLEFDTLCSSFSLLIADEGRCKQFLTLVTGIVQQVATADHSKLEGISKSNPATWQNLTTQVIHSLDSPDPEAEPQQFVRYLMIKLINEETRESQRDTTGETMSLVVTTTDIVLVRENHQWPLPRLQGPLSDDVRGRQFTIVQREKINNIESVMYNEEKPTELRITFFEASNAENARQVWLVAMETIKGVKSLVDSIRNPWEQEFGVSLDISSFSEDLTE